MIWQCPTDPDLQRELAEVIDELPPDGNLVPGSEQGVVSIGPAPDHRSTSVWFCKDREWINLEGYNFDAIQGAQKLVELANTGLQHSEKLLP